MITSGYVWFEKSVREHLDDRLGEKPIMDYFEELYPEESPLMKKLDVYVFPGIYGVHVAVPEDLGKRVLKHYKTMSLVRKDMDKLVDIMIDKYATQAKDLPLDKFDIVIYDKGLEYLKKSVEKSIITKQPIDGKLLDTTITPYRALGGLLGALG